VQRGKEAIKLRRTGLLSFIVAIVFLWAASGLAQERPERPPYREGEFWQFKYRSWDWMPLSTDSTRLPDGIYEIVYSQKQFRTFYAGPDEREEMSPANAKLMPLLAQGQDFQFPLAPGKKWSYEYTLTQAMGDGGPVHIVHWRRIVELNVEGIVSVSTGAGAFKAFKVVKVDRRIGSYRPREVTTYHYSEQTNSVVKMLFGGGGAKIEAVLIKHGIGPAALNLVSDPKSESTQAAKTTGAATASVPVTNAAIDVAQKTPQPSVPSLEAASAVMSLPPADRLELFIGERDNSVDLDKVAAPRPAAKAENAAPPFSAKPQAPAQTNQELALLTKSAPAVGAESLQLKMNIIGQRKEPDGNYSEVFINEGGALRSRDNFQVHLEASRPAYVYILIYDSEDRASQLFPDPKIDHSGFVEVGKSLIVPGPGSWFWLDDSTGTETIYVLASESPMTDIRGLLARMQTADDKGQQRASQEIKERIAVMQRGVGGITKGQAVTYTLSDGKKIQKVTDVVTGTGSVVRAVSFQHR
jgi:hypothetical protein